MEVSRRKAASAFLLLWICSSVPSANAFNSVTHDQITRSAFQYLNTHAHINAHTDRWLAGLGDNQWFMQEALVRAAIDADFRTDFWLDAWAHDPFTGANAKGGFTLFTGMFHYLNVTVRGDYWEHDGYAYRHGSHRDNDSYLNSPTATVKGSLSTAFGGRNDKHPVHGIDIGSYRTGFLGSEKDWRELFYGSNDAEDAVFPPANVPAQLAFDAMLRSARAGSNVTDSWNETLPLVTSLTKTGYLTRHYWRGEIRGLPLGFDLLGITLHMAQDLSVPQHAQGTADFCHQDFENLVDRLACKSPKNVDPNIYRRGAFGNDHPECQSLYDPALVASLLAQVWFLDPRKSVSIMERIRALAFWSARWQWFEPDDSLDFLATVLPNGKRYTADRCRDFMGLAPVHDQAKYQYNLAVAVSVAIFEVAAQAYENARPPAPPALDLFNLIRF